MKIIPVLILLITSVTYGQIYNDDLTKNINSSKEIYEELFMAQNYEQLSNYTSPKLIEHLKTKQDFVYLLTQLTKDAEMKGLTITGIYFGDHSEIIEHENELQTVVPFELILESEERLIKFNSGIALISFDKGKNWSFTFQIIKDKDENNEALGLNENISIPPRTQNITVK